MKRTTGLIRVLAVLAIAGLVMAPAASAFTIDTFENGGQTVTATINGTNPNSADLDVPTGVVGGERDIWVQATTGDDGATLTGQVVTAQGEYHHSEAASVLGTSAVTWDGNDNSATSLDHDGLGGVDLTDTNTQTGIGVVVNYATTGFDLKFDVYTDSSNWSSQTKSVGSVQPEGTDLLVFFPFTSFTTQAGTGADFTDVGAIVMTIMEPASGDTLGTVAQLSIVNSTVPEPGTICLALFSLVGGFFVRRKVRKQG